MSGGLVIKAHEHPLDSAADVNSRATASLGRRIVILAPPADRSAQAPRLGRLPASLEVTLGHLALRVVAKTPTRSVREPYRAVVYTQPVPSVRRQLPRRTSMATACWTWPRPPTIRSTSPCSW